MKYVAPLIAPILVVILTSAWRRSRRARPVSRREVLYVVALGVWAGFLGLGLTALARTQAPLGRREWVESMAALGGIGAIPLGVLLIFDAALWITRRYEDAARESSRRRP